MTGTEPQLERILHALSPEVLRSTIMLPHEQYREDFIPRFLSTASHDELITELGRFVQHVKRCWHHIDFDWPDDLSQDEARRLLNTAVGAGPHDRAGELAALRMCRHGDHGGLRAVLDGIVQVLQADALGRYLDFVVMPQIKRLPIAESLRLAAAYRDTFQTLPGIELEHPAAIAARWEQVLHEHARLVAGIGPRHSPVPRPQKASRSREGYSGGREQAGSSSEG